jgi:hypothetical protein
MIECKVDATDLVNIIAAKKMRYINLPCLLDHTNICKLYRRRVKVMKMLPRRQKSRSRLKNRLVTAAKRLPRQAAS